MRASSQEGPGKKKTHCGRSQCRFPGLSMEWVGNKKKKTHRLNPASRTACPAYTGPCSPSYNRSSPSFEEGRKQRRHLFISSDAVSSSPTPSPVFSSWGHTYQDTVKGATTLSPTATVRTPSPADTTVPVNSWPMTKPPLTPRSSPRYTCSSLHYVREHGAPVPTGQSRAV